MRLGDGDQPGRVNSAMHVLYYRAAGCESWRDAPRPGGAQAPQVERIKHGSEGRGSGGDWSHGVGKGQILEEVEGSEF